MANVFDIFSKKSTRSAEVSENEQMNRISPMTSGAGDSLQAKGVNNDSPFENQDGAKASGNNAYGAESRQDTQEAASPFTIPKLKRSKQELFVEMPTESREWQQEILPVLTKHFRFPSSAARFEFLRVSIVQNPDRTQKYLDKRREMRQNNYAERDVADSFAFLYIEDDKQIDRICREGLCVGNLPSSTIGHPCMGVQLCRYMDTIRSATFPPGATGKLFVFKIMKGKVKVVAENRTGVHLEPTPNYDSHMAKSSLDVTPASQQQLYELYQVYLYEYGEDMTVESYPRHVLPYAVIHFRYKDAPSSPRVPESPPILSPRLTSPPIPKFTLSAPKEADDPEYVIWCGSLRVKDILDCQVKMVSTASQYKPAHLGTVLNVRDTCEMKTAEERYFKELSCLRKSGEVYWKGWYINVAELRPRPDSKSQFQRLMNHLGRTNSMVVLKPENDVVLLLVPNCSLTHELGLTRPHHYPVMFHCIFISKQSAKFKSPRYLQKVLFHQRSGSSTPLGLESGQLSPITVSVQTPSRSSMAPGSPALLSPPPGLIADRPPGFTALPRDELTVWTDALSAGRSVKSAASSASENTEGSDKGNHPGVAHNLIRLHRNLSTDLASLGSPSKSIPLGYDEGFLSAMPLSARIDPLRLKSAFEIQYQIQDALSPESPLPCDLASSGLPVPMSPSLFGRDHNADVEQDDTITSSTSHDPTNLPASRRRTASSDAPFSPVPSPEKPSEPEVVEAEDLRTPSVSASLLAVPKESHPRSRSLYLPPPNIPEYKPTPLHEPSAKRSRLEDGSRHSSSVPSSDRGASVRGSSSSASSVLYRTSTPKVPSVGLTHVRSPRDLPLPISPADSSTDKVKSPVSASSNIATANDMKNFLNASLERKPPVKPPSSLSRSSSAFPVNPPVSESEADLSHLSDHCALSHHSSTQSATTVTSQNEPCEEHSWFTTATPIDSRRSTTSTMHVPSTIVSIPDSCVHHPPSARQSTKQLLVAGKRGEGMLDSVIIRRPEGLHSTQHPKASIIVHIPASALRRPPQKLLMWRSPPVVARKQRCSDMHEGATEATQHARETDNQLHGRAASDARWGRCLDQGPRDVHQGHYHGQIHCGRHHDQAPGDVHQSRCRDQATSDVRQGCRHDQVTGDVHQGCHHDQATGDVHQGHSRDQATGGVHQGHCRDQATGGVHQGHCRDQATGGVHQGHCRDQATGGVHQGHCRDQATGGVHQGHCHDQATGGVHQGHCHDQATGGVHQGHCHDQATGGVHQGHCHDQATGDVHQGCCHDEATTGTNDQPGHHPDHAPSDIHQGCLHDGTCTGIRWGHHLHGGAPIDAQQGHHLHNAIAGSHASIPFSPSLRKSQQVYTGHQTTDGCHVCCDSFHSVHPDHLVCTPPSVAQDGHQHHQPAMPQNGDIPPPHQQPQNGDIPPPHQQNSCHRHHHHHHHHHHRSELEPPRFCADSFTQVEAILPQDIHYTDHGRSLPPETHLRTADPGLSVTRETLPGEQNSAPRHHQALLNSSHSVPLDVLELIRRLRAVAKERMIENTVAKLINCQFSGANEESAASSMSGSPGPVVAAKTETCWKDELCKTAQHPHRAPEFGAAADGAAEEGACGSPSTACHSRASSLDHHHSCPRPAAALGSGGRHELQDCGILCEPSPANQKREKGCDSQKLNRAYNRLGPPAHPSQAETDADTSVEESPYSDSTGDEAGPCRVLAADNQSPVTAPRGARWVSSLAGSGRCVPPVLLKRQVGALRKKFTVVRHQGTPRVVTGKNAATRKRAGKKSVHRITKKFKQKNFQLQSNMLMKMFSTEVNDLEWKKKKGLSVDIATTCAKESFPFPARFELATDMWQSSGLTHAQVMVLSTDNSSSSQGAMREALSAPTAAHLGTSEVSETISALIGPRVPEGDLEACDSDVIVEQIDKLLSESSSPLRVKDYDSFRVDEPAQDTEQDAQLSGGAGSLEPIPTSVEACSSSANQEKCESSHVECSKRTRARQSRKKGPPYNSIKLKAKKTHSVCLSDRNSDGTSEQSSAIAASKCTDAESVCGDFENRFVESATSVPQASPGSLASALQRFEILHPHVLKSCSVVLSDLKNTKLLLNLKASCKTECDENKGSTNTACGYRSSRKLRSNRKKHSAKTGHDFYRSEKGNTATAEEDSASTTGKNHAGTTGKDSASVAEKDDASVTEKDSAGTAEKEGACTTFPAALTVMPAESASVHSQLENNQPLEQTIVISSESETGSRKQRAASEQMCQITNQCLESMEERKHSRSLQVQKVKEKSQPAQDEHPGSVQPTSRRLRKADSTSAGTLAKQQPSSLRKQGGAEAKRKVKPSGKTSASGVTKQLSVPQSHSWEDVLELMNSLSGSSCTNKPPAEAVRTSLPRIPKRSKCSSDSASARSVVTPSVSEGQADSKQTEREKPATADPDPSASSGKALGFGGLGVVRPGQSEHRRVSSAGSLASTVSVSHPEPGSTLASTRSVSHPEPESPSSHVGSIRETVCGAMHSVTTASSNPCQVSMEAFPVNKCSSMPVGYQLPLAVAWPGNKLTHSWRPSPTLHGRGSISTQAVGGKDLASSQSLTALQVAQSVSALEQTIKSVVESIKSQQRPGSVHVPCSGTGDVAGPRSVTDHLAQTSGNRQSSLRSSGIPRDPRRGAKGCVGTAQPAQSVSVPRCVQTESAACQALSVTRPSDLIFSGEVKSVQSNSEPEPCFVLDKPAAERLHKYAVSRGHQSEPEPCFVSDNPAAEQLHKCAVSQGHHPRAAVEVNAPPEKGLVKTVLSSPAQERGCGPTTLKSPREQKQEHEFLSHPKTAQEQGPNGSDEAKSSHVQSATEDQVQTEIPTDQSRTGGEVEPDQEQLSRKAPVEGIAPQETVASRQGQLSRKAPVKGIAPQETVASRKGQLSRKAPVEGIAPQETVASRQGQLSRKAPVEGIAPQETVASRQGQLSRKAPVEGIAPQETVASRQGQLSRKAPVEGIAPQETVASRQGQLSRKAPVEGIAPQETVASRQGQLSKKAPVEGIAPQETVASRQGQLSRKAPVEGIAPQETVASRQGQLSRKAPVEGIAPQETVASRQGQLSRKAPVEGIAPQETVASRQGQLSRKAPVEGIAPQETVASQQGQPGAAQELTGVKALGESSGPSQTAAGGQTTQELTEVKALEESSGPSQTAAGGQTTQEMTASRALQESAAAAQASTEAVCTRKAAQAQLEQTEVDFTHDLVEDTEVGVSDLTGASLPDTSAHSAVVQAAFSHSVASLPDASACSSGNQASEKNHGPHTPGKFQDEEEDEAFSFSSAEYFTVIDECGDPDAVWNMPVSDVVVRHLDLERRLRGTYTGGKASKSEDAGASGTGRKKDHEDERKSADAKQSSKMGRKRPQIHPNYYSFFAKTVVKAHEENQKIDMEQKKRMANKASLFKSQTASSRNLSSSDLMLENRQARRSRSSEQKRDCRRHAAKGSRSPSNQLKRKSRSPSIPKRARSGSPYDRRRSRSPLYQQRSGSAHECRRSRSPHRRRSRSPVEQLKRKSWSPGARRRPGSVSPDVQQRSRSPSVRPRVGSPSGRGDDRGYQPARGHDKEQVAEDRQGRRYRPYGSRQDRDSRSERQERGTDCGWQRRWGTEHKPIASFQLAYKELNELLADKTSQTFQRRMVDPSDDRRPLESLFSKKRYSGKRFQGYRFQRSKIPSLAEFRTCKCKVLASLERRVAATEMVETDSDSGEEEREEAQEAERARLAQVLDEMMGEAEEPRQEEKAERNVINEQHVRIANPVSASTFVCDEDQDSPLLTDKTGSSSGRFPVGTGSTSSVGSEPEESSSNVSMQVATDSQSVLLGECEELSSKSPSLSGPPVVPITDQSSEKSANCHLASQTAQRRAISPNTGIEVHFGGGQHEESSGQPKKSKGEILEEYYRQRLIKLHEERQRQFKAKGQQGSNHSRRKSVQCKASGCNDARPDAAHQFGQRRQRHSSEPSHPKKSSTADNQAASEHLPGLSRHQSHSGGRSPHGLSQSLPQVMTRDTLQSSRADPSGQRTPPGPCPDDSPSNIPPVVPQTEPRIGPQTPPRPGQPSVHGKKGHFNAPWPASGPTDPRLSHQQRCVTAVPRTPLGTNPSSEDGGITVLRQTRRGPRTPPGPGPDDDGPAVNHVSGLEHLCSSSSGLGQKAPSSASVGMKGDGSAEPQPLQAAAAGKDTDSGTVLKIINTAKLSASAGQTADHLPRHPPGPRAAAGGGDQTGGPSSHPYVMAVNASFMVPADDLSSLYSAVHSPVNTCSPALTPLAPNEDASRTPSQPLESGATPPSSANQNMELLIQKLQVFMEQNATRAARAAKVKPKRTRGHRPPRLENRVPWIVRIWPNTPIPITFVEREPDYQLNPSLGEKEQAVETTLDGPDPRLNPDRPPFMPAGKSEQATASLALKEKKRLFVSGIRVVRDIPLDLQATIHAGRSIPRDPRQPFRSSVAEMDLELDQAESEEAGKAAVDFEKVSRNRDNERQEQRELQMKSAADGSEISSGRAAEVTPSSSGQTSGVALEFKDGGLCSVPGVIWETDDKKNISSKHSASTRSDLPDYAGQSSKARPAEHEGSDSKSLTLVITPREEAPQASVSTNETEEGKETSQGRKRPFEHGGASPDISKKPRIASPEGARIHRSADSSRCGGDACCRQLTLVQKIGSYKKETLHKRSRKACMGSAYRDRHDRKESSGQKPGEEGNGAIGEKGRDVADLESSDTRMDSRTKPSHNAQSTGVSDKFSRLRDALNEELLNDLLQMELEPDCAEDHKETDQTLAGSGILPSKLRSSRPLTSSPLFLPPFRFREESGSMQEVCGAISNCHTGHASANTNSRLDEEKAASADTAEFEQCAAVAEAQQIPASADQRRASAVSVETSSLPQGSEVGVGTFKKPSLNPASPPRDKDQREPNDTSHTNWLSEFGTAANEGKMKKTEGRDVGVFTTDEESVCKRKGDFPCDATEQTSPTALSKPGIHAISCSVSCTGDEAATGVLSKSVAGIVNCSAPSDEDESRTGVLSESAEARTGVPSKSVAGVVTCCVSSSEGGTKAGVVSYSLSASEVEGVSALQDGQSRPGIEEESSVLGCVQDDTLLTQEQEPLEPEVSQQEPLEPEVSQQEPLEPEVSQQEPLEPEVSQVPDPAVCSTFMYISDKNVDGSFLAGSLHAETVVTTGRDMLSARQDTLGENSGADYVYSSSGTERRGCVIKTVVSASLGSAVVSQSRSTTVISSSEMQTAPWNKIPTIVSPRSMLPDSGVYPPVGQTPTLWMPSEGASQGLSATAVNPSPISHHSCQGNAGLSQMFTSGSPAVIQNVASHTSGERMLNVGVGMTRYAYQPHYGSVSGTVGLYVGHPVDQQFSPQGGALLNSPAGVNAGSQLRSGCHSLFLGGLPGGVPVPLQQLVTGLPSNNAARTCTPWGAPPGNVAGGSAAWQVPVIQNSSSMVRQTDMARRMPVNVAASNEADWGTSARTVTGCSFPPMGLRQGAAGNGADSSAALVRNVATVDSSQRGAYLGLARADGRIDSAQSPGSAPPRLPDAAGVEVAWPYCSFQ